MEGSYKVVFDGKLREGVDREQFVRAFAQMFKVSEEQARKLLSVGRPVALKDNLDQATAEKYRAVMNKLGMEVRLEQKDGLSLVADDSAAVAPGPEQAPQQQPAAADSGPRCPKCGSDRVQGDDCLACGVIISRYRAKQGQAAAEGVEQQNPYAAPQSDVSPVRVYDAEEGELTGPHAVPAGDGWQWIVGGWRHLQRNPFAWIGALFVCYALLAAINFVPLVGPIVGSLLGPVIFAGFMLGADEQRTGGDFRIGHLFAGFSANPGKLVQVGLLYGLGMFVIVGGAGVIAALAGMGGMLHAHGGHPDPRMSGRVVSLMLGAMVLTLPLLMAYWFAPALVALDDRGPLEAMKLSFRAGLKTCRPFWLCVLSARGRAGSAAIPRGLGMLIFMPMMIATIYAAYRDIFYQTASI